LIRRKKEEQRETDVSRSPDLAQSRNHAQPLDIEMGPNNTPNASLDPTSATSVKNLGKQNQGHNIV
jgi:hypothetical protein